MRLDNFIRFNLILIPFLILAVGVASADNINNIKLNEGDAYQVNNYVIELTDILKDGEDYSILIDIYELKPDGTHTELSTQKFKDSETGLSTITYESGSIKIQVFEKNTSSTLYSRIDIVTSGFVVENKEYVEGGVSNAKYIGDPLIILTKEVDKSSVEIGDTIRVTIKAKNSGDGPAKNINIDPGISPGFTFKSNIYTTYPSELEVGNTYIQMFIYEIQAATSGSFTLNPAKATYYSAALDDEYTATSNRPVVTVASAPVETADLDLKISMDKTKLKRGDKITFIVYVENLKDVPASTVKIEPVIPKNLTYLPGSSSEEIDVINEKPLIQENTYGARYENDYKFVFRADEIGSNSLTVKLTYNDGVNDITKEVTSDTFKVEKGKYDYLAEFPIYVYITPVVIIIAIAGWLYWRSSQFRM